MCEKAVEDDLWQLEFVPDHFKTKKMCERAVEEKPWSLLHVPDWFVTQEQVKLLHDDNE